MTGLKMKEQMRLNTKARLKTRQNEFSSRFRFLGNEIIREYTPRHLRTEADR